MQDLNDVFYFSQVVAQGGFTAAGRALGLPKSKLSRRVSQLEERLGVRLLERSSRHFRVTDIGRTYYEQCRLALDAAERAEALVSASLTEPRGLVRCACPLGLVELVSPLLPEFLELYPRVRVQLVVTDRAVDIVSERIDVALRVRTSLQSDPGLTVRTLARSRRILLASPSLMNALETQREISALDALPTLSTSDEGTHVTWQLEKSDGTSYAHKHQPRLGCSDFTAVRDAAIAGLGVALLPDHACVPALRSGALVRVFPDYAAMEGIVHVVFTTRKGLPRAVRAFIDQLAKRLSDRALFPSTPDERHATPR
jgi:DNA-binding transcriptional LysR family regulator